MSASPESASMEMCVLNVKECFVFKVPPLKTASGHRAEDWGIDKPILTGYLKVFQADNKLRIVIYRYKDPDISETADNLLPFAECPIVVNPNEDITPFVDAVIDSSRYFAIRIKDSSHSTRSAIIGIGFRERDTALDFKHVLNDYVRYIGRMAQAEKLANQHDLSQQCDDSSDQVVNSAKDMSIKDGETIHINVPRRVTKASSGGTASGDIKKVCKGGLLPPPPAPGVEVEVGVSTDLGSKADHMSKDIKLSTNITTTDAEDEDEWGDFVS